MPTETPPLVETTPAAPPTPAAETATQESQPAPELTRIEGEHNRQDGAEQARTAFMNDADFWGNIMAGKKAEADAEAAPETDAEKPAETEPEKPAKAEKPKKTKAEKKEPEEPEKPAPAAKTIVKKRDPEDDQRIADIAATAATRAVAAVAPRQEPKVEKPDDNAALLARLDDDAKEDAMVLVEMERLNPAKHSGLLKKFVSYREKEADYVRKWERENPGQKFDRESDAHNAWYDENEPVISETDRKKAEREIYRREAREEAERAVAPIRERAETEAKVREIAPVIRNVEGNALGFMLTTMKPEADEVLQGESGFAKLRESDPELVETAIVEFERVRPLLNETVKIFSGATRPDPANNKVHKEIIDTYMALELEMSNQTDASGRRIVPMHQFVQMTPAEQARHATVEQNELLIAIAKNAAAKASETYKKDQERFEAIAKRKGYVQKSASDSTPKPAAAKPAAPPPKPSNGETTRPSPSGAGRIQVDTNQTLQSDDADSFMKFFGHGVPRR